MGGVGKSSGVNEITKTGKNEPKQRVLSVTAGDGISEKEVAEATKVYQEAFKTIQKADPTVKKAVEQLFNEGLQLYIVDRISGRSNKGNMILMGLARYDEYDRTQIYISRATLAAAKNPLKQKYDSNGNPWNVGTTATHVIMHELGHAITRKYVKTPGVPRSKVDMDMVVKEAHRKYVEEQGHKIGLKYFTQMVSRYASTNSSETIAEAFSDVIVNKHLAHDASRYVYDELNKYIKRNK